jgi:hypothetical protein
MDKVMISHVYSSSVYASLRHVHMLRRLQQGSSVVRDERCAELALSDELKEWQ